MNFENKIIHVSATEMVDIKYDLYLDKSIFIAELNGKKIHLLWDYLSAVNKIFKFPTLTRSLDGYLDWMRDLDWLDSDGYALIIYNYKDFLSHDQFHKKVVIDYFRNEILPWWEKDVENYVVEGKAKKFNVYLIEAS